MSKKSIFKILVLGIFLVLNIYIWSEISSINSDESLKVVFLDVGQGDAIFIQTSLGNQVLIDGGSNDDVLRELSKIMPFFDRTIDVVIATHPDSDHIGGLVSVLDRFEVGIYMESGSKSETLIYQSLEETLSRKNISRILAKRGMVLDLGQSISLNILFPDRDVSRVEPNLASIITQVNYRDISFMLTGDSPSSVEKYLSSIYGASLESEVLKAGHHGSKTSSAIVFVGLVAPEYGIISAGEGNRYGHPNLEVLDTLNSFDISILETSKNGSIVFISDGKNVWLD